jgi:hypothetical protein
MNVNNGDTTDPYKAALLDDAREPLVAGEIQIIQIPHQHNILHRQLEHKAFAYQGTRRTPRNKEDDGTMPKDLAIRAQSWIKPRK